MGSSQSAPPGDTMRAVIRGGKPDMAYNAAYAAPPAPGKNEVRLRVRAAGINPVDYKVSKMILGPVVGLDVSGVVEGVGEGVTTLAIGDEVYGTAKGSLADYVVAKASSLARKPAHLSFPEAAAMPTAYLTALQGLRDYGKLPPGGRVLIIGASGGCGQAAVQLAKHALQAGFIAGVCSARNADTVRGLGAHRVVDYTTETLAGVFGELPDEEKFDVVFDAATNSGGGEAYKEQCLPLLRPASKDKGEPHGQYVAINGAVGMWLRKFTIGQKKNEHLFLTNANTADLAYLASLMDAVGTGDGTPAAQVKPVICRVLPFSASGVHEGFELLKSRRAVGKVVFDIAASREGAAGISEGT